jgi:hypothetical protein
MKTLNNPENLKSHGQHDLVQINESPTAGKKNNYSGPMKDYVEPRIDKRREEIENILESLEGANMSATIKALNGIERGSYRISISRDSVYNEVQVRLKDGPSARQPIAVGYIDQGHTRESRFEAAAEVRGLVRAYLCR